MLKILSSNYPLYLSVAYRVSFLQKARKAQEAYDWECLAVTVAVDAKSTKTREPQ